MKRITVTVTIDENPNDTVDYRIFDIGGNLMKQERCAYIADASLDIGATVFEQARDVATVSTDPAENMHPTEPCLTCKRPILEGQDYDYFHKEPHHSNPDDCIRGVLDTVANGIISILGPQPAAPQCARCRAIIVDNSVQFCSDACVIEAHRGSNPFTKRETATILAALRWFQKTIGYLDAGGFFPDLGSHWAEIHQLHFENEEAARLSPQDIDVLCESINGGDVANRDAGAAIVELLENLDAMHDPSSDDGQSESLFFHGLIEADTINAVRRAVGLDEYAFAFDEKALRETAEPGHTPTVSIQITREPKS